MNLQPSIQAGQHIPPWLKAPKVGCFMNCGRHQGWSRDLFSLGGHDEQPGVLLLRRFCLIPALAGTGPRQGLHDNHSAHRATAQAVDALCRGRRTSHPAAAARASAHTAGASSPPRCFLSRSASLSLSLSLSLCLSVSLSLCVQGQPPHPARRDYRCTPATSADPSSPTADPASLLR